MTELSAALPKSPQSALALLTAPLGRHLLLELCGCPSERLDDPSGLQDAMLEAARAAGATVLSQHFHRFSPQGVTGVLLLAESHLALHSWPELGYAAVDFFTCGSHADQEYCLALLAKALGATHFTARELSRGDPHDIRRGLTVGAR